jgi:hypothetical protein
MRLPLKTVKPQDLILLVIWPTIHMDTDALIVLETTVLDPKPEHTGRDIDSMGWVSIVAWWLHHISFACTFMGEGDASVLQMSHVLNLPGQVGP